MLLRRLGSLAGILLILTAAFVPVADAGVQKVVVCEKFGATW